MLRLAMVVIVLSLTGCASFAIIGPNAPQKLNVRALPKAHGVAVLSFTSALPHQYDEYWLRYRRWSGPDNRVHNGRPLPPIYLGAERDDVQQLDRAGSLFVMILPYGRYELRGFMMMKQRPPWTLSYSSRDQEVSIPFEVAAGGVTYLGEVTFLSRRVFSSGEDWWKEAGWFVLANQWERDSQSLKAWYPTLDLSAVLVRPLQTNEQSAVWFQQAAPEDIVLSSKDLWGDQPSDRKRPRRELLQPLREQAPGKQ